MKIKMILPVLREEKNPVLKAIKYSLYPPLGLATLAAYFTHHDEIDLQDEYVEELNLNEEHLVVIQGLHFQCLSCLRFSRPILYHITFYSNFTAQRWK